MPKGGKSHRRTGGLRSADTGGGFAAAQSASSFPERARTTLKYVSYLRVNPGVLTGTDTVFSLNGVFDPEVSGTGHQPREYDVWAALYGKYRVMRVLVRGEVRQRASHGIEVSLIPTNSATAMTSTQIPQELPRAVHCGTTGSNQPVVHFRQVFKPNEILGMTMRQYLDNEDTAAAVGSNPGEQPYLHLWAQQLDSATVLDCEYYLELEYDVEWYDRIISGTSVDVGRELAQLRARLAAFEDAEVVVPQQVAPAPPARTVGGGGRARA